MNIMHNLASNGIPLHCNICPKKPDFSDTSHLLTHIASKQHLSNYYKLKVSISVNPIARRDIDDYDRWYSQWNLDELMRDRMTQKEKRGRGGGVARRGPAATATSGRSTPVPPTMTAPRRESSLRNALLDPTLDRRIKIEPISRPSSPSLIPLLETSAFHRSYAPMQTWPSTPYAQSPSLMGTSNGYLSDMDDDDDSSYVYPAPRNARRVYRRKGSDETGSWYGSLHGFEYMGDDMYGDEPPNDSTKLKGEIWPGMDIFDSATPEMRRKRNQKKSTNVVMLLEATSLIIEPTELVFDNAGMFKRQRTITGEPTSDSPLEGETTPEPDSPPLKKRALRSKGNTRRPRQALAEKDVNSGQSMRGRRAFPRTQALANPHGPYFDGSGDDLDDDSLTFQPQRPQRRSGLSIHRDNTGPDITFDRSPNMSYLTSGFAESFAASQNSHSSVLITQPHLDLNTSQVSNGSYQPQPVHRHSNRPSLGGFRATDNHGLPARDLSAFGALTNHTMFPSNNHFVSNAIAGGAPVVNTFSQHFTPTTQTTNGQNLIPDDGLNLQGFDVFASNSAHDSAFGTMDFNFSATDPSGLNPLWCGETAPQEDDEGTISAPVSERSAD